MHARSSLKEYQVEYLKDNGHLFTMQQMADYLGVSYAVTRNAYERYKLKSVPVSCKEAIDHCKRPSIEEYKTVFKY